MLRRRFLVVSQLPEPGLARSSGKGSRASAAGALCSRRRFAEVEGRHGRDPRVECRCYGRRIAAGRDCSEKDDPITINVLPLEQQIDPAHDIPDHPLDETFSGYIELHSHHVARMVGFPVPRMILDPLTVADLIHDQHGAAGASPQDTHVLKFGLRPRTMMTMNDDHPRHARGGDWPADRD